MHSLPRRAARSSLLIATIAISLALPGLARAQAPAAPAPQAAPGTQAPVEAVPALAAPEMQTLPDAPPPQAVPGTQGLPDAIPAQAPGAQPMVHVVGWVDEKDPGVAVSGSLLVTAAGIGTMVVGLGTDNGALGLAGFTATLLGPSFGHFYAGEYGRGLAHSGLRLGATVMTVAGAAWTGSLLLGCAFGDDSDCGGSVGAPLLLVGGVVLGGASIVHSIQDGPRAVRRYNERARARQLRITPAPIVGPDHSAGLGLQLGGRF